MIDSIFHWLLATFVLAPVQAQINERLRQAQVPAAVSKQVQACLTTAGPALVNRASGDWIWGATTVISVATGNKDPLDLLAKEAPACRFAVQAIRQSAST